MDQTAGPTVPAPQAAVPRAGQAPGSFSDRVPVLAWLIAVAFVAVELAVSGRYGFMQDELYFVEASRHLAFGYVDQPPLTPLLTRVAELPGLSPTAIRIIPAPAGGAVVVAAARFAALFGVDQLGRVLATITMACTPSCSAPTTWTTPRRWTCWPGPWCCWVSPRHCCGTGRGGGSAPVVMSPKLASAGAPQRLTAAALLPAVMGTIMDHPCLLPFRRAVIGVMGRNPRVRNRTGGCGGRLGVHDPGASIRELPRVDDGPGRFTVGASGLRFHGGRGAP